MYIYLKIIHNFIPFWIEYFLNIILFEKNKHADVKFTEIPMHVYIYNLKISYRKSEISIDTFLLVMKTDQFFIFLSQVYDSINLYLFNIPF